MKNGQLVILEVSQKQAYIFAPRELRSNRLRSLEIAYVTSPEFFRESCPAFEDSQLVYTGGGHTVLFFETEQQAREFACSVTEQAARRFPDMELYVRSIPADPGLTPSENLLALSKALEQKKALRRQSFRTLQLGMEKWSVAVPKMLDAQEDPLPEGWEWTTDEKKLLGEDPFLAVVHLDGNAMGKRVQNIYARCGSDWEKTVSALRLFSSEIDRHFREAFREMTAELLERLEASGQTGGYVPVRKLIAAGDDVCFLTAGRLGLDCAASFLEHLSSKVNAADGERYTACAGVVLVHSGYPFRKAYDLSEALCSSAKRFAAEQGGNLNALDFHIQYGQLEDSLSRIRADYRAEDGSRMELRPYAVGSGAQTARERQYDFLREMIVQVKQNEYSIARSKLKTLRQAFRQGKTESEYAMRTMQAKDLLYVNTNKKRSGAFVNIDGIDRCLYFDAIELMDAVEMWREAEV